MRQQGLEVIKRETTLVERIAPFEPLAITYLDRYLKAIASSAQEFPISDGDKAEWRRIGESIDEILQDPDACYREAFTLTVGRRKS